MMDDEEVMQVEQLVDVDWRGREGGREGGKEGGWERCASEAVE